jgi:hypothetical protein
MSIKTTERNTWKVEGELFGQTTTVFESADIFECIAWVQENDR